LYFATINYAHATYVLQLSYKMCLKVTHSYGDLHMV